MAVRHEANDVSKTKLRIPTGILFRLAISLALVPLSAGCSRTSSAAFQLSDPSVARHLGPAKSADDVEVWLDAAPRRDFIVVGELQASSIDSPASIGRMQARAAELGFDGIYYVECVGACSGACKARAFVYGDEPVGAEGAVGGDLVVAGN